MPSLQEIRQFNNRLITMGSEPEVVRQWGEELEEVPVPEGGLDEDLSSLLSDTGEEAGPPTPDELFEGEPAPPAGEPPAGAPADLESLLAEEAEEVEEAESVRSADEEETEGAQAFEPTSAEPAELEPEGETPETGGPMEEGDFSDFEALL
ncbi:MAG: periplasmic-type flagellar collar protein FlcA, partial [Spirochaetota bacterium]